MAPIFKIFRSNSESKILHKTLIFKPSGPQIQSKFRFDGQLLSGKFSARTDFSRPRSGHINFSAGPTTSRANYLEPPLALGSVHIILFPFLADPAPRPGPAPDRLRRPRAPAEPAPARPRSGKIYCQDCLVFYCFVVYVSLFCNN